MTTTNGRFFRLPGGALGVVCTGDFYPRALVAVGRVGDVPVVGLTAGPDGTIAGTLVGTPRPGDELVISYPPEPEIRTGLTYAPPDARRDLPVA